MRRIRRIVSLTVLGLAMKASHVLAAGGAPWDTQMQTV
jgi:hypothetical protein